MGKGKSKINHFIHRYPKSSIFLILAPLQMQENKYTDIKNILNYKYSLYKLQKGLIKIKLKFPKLYYTNIIS